MKFYPNGTVPKAEVSRWLLKMFNKTRANASVSQKASVSETGMPEAMWSSRRN